MNRSHVSAFVSLLVAGISGWFMISPAWAQQDPLPAGGGGGGPPVRRPRANERSVGVSVRQANLTEVNSNGISGAVIGKEPKLQDLAKEIVACLVNPANDPITPAMQAIIDAAKFNQTKTTGGNAEDGPPSIENVKTKYIIIGRLRDSDPREIDPADPAQLAGNHTDHKIECVKSGEDKYGYQWILKKNLTTYLLEDGRGVAGVASNTPTGLKAKAIGVFSTPPKEVETEFDEKKP